MANVTDVARLEEVLALIKREGLKASAVVVGDIRLMLIEPEKERPRQTLAQGEQKELEALRRRSRELFGRTLPDDELKQMRGAL